MPNYEPSGISDADRDDGKRFVVHAYEMLTAFVKLERVSRESLRFPKCRMTWHD
jgi:hypothetical protein